MAVDAKQTLPSKGSVCLADNVKTYSLSPQSSLDKNGTENWGLKGAQNWITWRCVDRIADLCRICCKVTLGRVYELVELSDWYRNNDWHHDYY
ncbi:hypothetical protein IYO2065_26830 [Lactiplantibacillus plantarum]|nr:hypothetical protein IYO2065_26830 [Lactiplantibacillus plantarum]